MTWITLRYGLMKGMGRHCPSRKLKRLALIILLAAATLCAAITAVRSASATAALLGEAQTDRENLIALLNGARLVEQKPDGTRIYTHAVLNHIEIPLVMVGLNSPLLNPPPQAGEEANVKDEKPL